MAKMPADRVQPAAPQTPAARRSRARAKPEVFVTVAGQQFKKPDLDVHFVETLDTGEPGQCGCDAVSVVCSCNKVCTCNPQSCGCVGYSAPCTCDPQGGGGGGGGGSWCSCNKVCSCVPVH